MRHSDVYIIHACAISECGTALDTLGLCRTNPWEDTYEGVPVGCSHRAKCDAHFNHADKGKAREDLSPVCKRDSSQTDTQIDTQTPKEKSPGVVTKEKKDKKKKRDKEKREKEKKEREKAKKRKKDKAIAEEMAQSQREV